MIVATGSLGAALAAGLFALLFAGVAPGQASGQAPGRGSVQASTPPAGGAVRPTDPANPTGLVRRAAERPWTGDFDAMLDRRMIRFAVPYSRTLYFIDKGRELGVSAELIRGFEAWLNRKYAKRLGKRPLTVFIEPTSRDVLFHRLDAGLADVAVGNLTVTPERLRRADFVAPPDTPPNVEVVVTGPASPPLASLDDLAGHTVQVRRDSSYHDSLVALNARLVAAGKPEVRIVTVPDALEDEDMMEMVGAGLLDTIVVDEWKARIWAQVLPGVTIRGDLVLRPAGIAGWAVRKGSVQLAAEITDYYASTARRDGLIPYEHAAYLRTIKQLNGALASADRKRFEALVGHFRTYGGRYGFDPLMLAAQGYQESRLDQSKRSAVGAIGIMQIMPATAAALNVGDITVAEANIHAGAKYLDQIIAHNFQDADLDPADRALFAFASYNAGPAAIQRMRREAHQRGLDPNRWFRNVELVTAESIGVETTTYVRNIYKYYVAYRLSDDAAAAARELQRELHGGAAPEAKRASPSAP